MTNPNYRTVNGICRIRPRNSRMAVILEFKAKVSLALVKSRGNTYKPG